MKVIGLTGASGAGKSLAAAILQEYGLPVIDADRVYHEILAKKGTCTDELAAAFGQEILDENGQVCRSVLAATVFSKPNTDALLHTLNTITHKYVMCEVEKRLHALQADGIPAAVLDAPLLFEANAHLMCDLVIGILADRALRVQRIIARDRITEEQAQKRLLAGKSDDFFKERCDHILQNNNDKAALAEKIKAILVETGVLVG